MFIKRPKKTYNCWWRARALSFSYSANKTKSATALILVYILALVCYAREEVIDPIASFSGSFFFVSRERKRGWERGCRLDANAVWEISLPPSPYCNLQMLFTFRWGGTGGSESPASRTTFSRLPYFCKLQTLFTFRWGGTGGVRVSRFLYFCVPLTPDSHPWLCCSHLHVNQSLTFKLSQNLTFLSIFWPLFWREDHWVPIKVIKGQFS